jgi:serine/threonine protein kinase/Tol biopolymer transport system component
MSANLKKGTLLRKRYRIVEILGQGGMGAVYRAVDENLGMDVAVKENLFTTDEFARQFRLEAVILASLRHANLPRVTDHFVIPDQGQYLIMDFIDGEDLRQRMERAGPIPAEEAILVGAAMCDALEYLHTRNPSIIHRDLKPGNIRITPDGHIFLVDFGLAKLVKGSQATTTGARAMTPGYSPPEQYGNARTTPRTDVYSLGATLYATLAGVIPEDSLARAMDNLELTSLRKHNPAVPRKLAAAIEKAMAVHQEDRFQSAQEFKQALLSSSASVQHLKDELIVSPASPAPQSEVASSLASELPGEPGNVPPSPPFAPPGKGRNPAVWIFSAFFLLAGILVLLSMLLSRSPLRNAFLGLLASATSSSTSIPTPIPATPGIPVNHPATLPPLPDKSAATLPAPAPSFTPAAQTSPADTRMPLPTFMPSITPPPTVTSGPTPTLVGGGTGQIAIVSDRNGLPQVFLMNADGSGDLQPLTNMVYGACQPAWSPDGLRLVVVSPCPARQGRYPGAKLYIINGGGSGMPSELPSVEGGDFDPAWSPDGTHIAFTSLRNGDPQVYVLQLDDNIVTRLTEASSDLRQPKWSMQPAWSPDGTQIVYTGYGPLTDALQIWVMSDTGQSRRFLIPRGPYLWNFLPAWSPDGNTILFGETSGDQQLGWLMLFNNQTSNVVHLRPPAFGTHGAYSPDGMWVIYESKDNQDLYRLDYDIFRLKSDGSGPITALTNDLSMEFDPAWRPPAEP